MLTPAAITFLITHVHGPLFLGAVFIYCVHHTAGISSDCILQDKIQNPLFFALIHDEIGYFLSDYFIPDKGSSAIFPDEQHNEQQNEKQDEDNEQRD